MLMELTTTLAPVLRHFTDSNVKVFTIVYMKNNLRDELSHSASMSAENGKAF